MTPEQIREEARRRLQEEFGKHFNEDPTYMSGLAGIALEVLEDLLPTGGIRYAVAHPVLHSEARFVGFTLEECKRFATEFDTHVIEQHLTEWTTHE